MANINTPNLKIIAHIFEDCTKLISANLSNINTSSVTDYQNVFYGCKSLRKLDISGFDFRGAGQYNCMNIFAFKSSIEYASLYKIISSSCFNYGYSYSVTNILRTGQNYIICQSGQIVATNIGNRKDICCDYSLEIKFVIQLIIQ